MKYKIYIVENTDRDNLTGYPLNFIKADFNWDDGCDSIEEANELINKQGDNYVNYTILPYVYMTS